MTSEELKEIRSDVNLSQDKFAREIGVSASTIRSWENKANPIPEWAEKLIKLTADKLKKK